MSESRSSTIVSRDPSQYVENRDAVKESPEKEQATIVDAEKQQQPGSAQPVLDFPDGGWEAWSVILGAWCVSFCTWGYVNAWGVYQEIYQANQLSKSSPSDIAWIGSVQIAMLMWGGVATGRLFDRGHLRPIIIIGSIWVVFCVMMTSLATTFWQIILAQGIGLGMGLGAIFTPALATVPHFFKKRRALANGILASGSSCGGIIFPIMLNKLVQNPNVGFAWAVRATGFLMLGLLLVANFLLKTRLPPNKAPGPIIDFREFRDTNFLLFTMGCFFILFGLYMPFFYLEEYALTKGVDPNLAFYTLAILNAASVFGRIIPNYIADKMGGLNVLGTACGCSALMIFIFLALKTPASFVIFAIFFGFFSGSYVSSMGVGVASLTTDMRTIGLRFSMYFLVNGFAALTGTPICGAIIVLQNGKYTGAAIFSGVSVVLGCVILFFARTRHAAVKGTQKV